VGLVFWKFSTGSNRSPGEGKRVDGKSGVALPLKLERLTATGQCRLAEISPDGKALIYATERLSSQAIMKHSLSEGRPGQIVDFAEDSLFDFGYSADGQFFAVTRGGWQHDIVLISDLNR
jgi:Tol biopolymer transport system component